MVSQIHRESDAAKLVFKKGAGVECEAVSIAIMRTAPSAGSFFVDGQGEENRKNECTKWQRSRNRPGLARQLMCPTLQFRWHFRSFRATLAAGGRRT